MGSKRRVVVVLLAAAAFGVAMAAIKGQGTGARDALGNVSAPWLLLAFIAGATAARGRLLSAAAAGITASLAALLSFYVAESRLLDLGAHSWLVDLRLAVVAGRIYIATALMSGPIFGVLGGVWSRRRAPLVGLTVGAMFVLEPVAVWLVEHWQGSVASTGLLTQYPWLWGGEIVLGLAGSTLLVRARNHA